MTYNELSDLPEENQIVLKIPAGTPMIQLGSNRVDQILTTVPDAVEALQKGSDVTITFRRKPTEEKISSAQKILDGKETGY